MTPLQLAMKRPRVAPTTGAVADDLHGGVDMADSTCSIDGCDKPAAARGWCRMHYGRWRTTGEVGSAEPLRQSNKGRRCKLDGCPNAAHSLGWCQVHYARWKRHGGFERRHAVSDTPILDRILPRLDVADCWLWVGARCYGGYARLGFGGRTYAVHRLIWEELVGPIPPGYEIDHLCRVRHCVNPDHLEPVTKAENIRRGLGAAMFGGDR